MQWKMKKKNSKWVFIFQKYDKFWSISLGHFIKHKLLISEECNITNTHYTTTKVGNRYNNLNTFLFLWVEKRGYSFYIRINDCCTMQHHSALKSEKVVQFREIAQFASKIINFFWYFFSNGAGLKGVGGLWSEKIFFQELWF